MFTEARFRPRAQFVVVSVGALVLGSVAGRGLVVVVVVPVSCPFETVVALPVSLVLVVGEVVVVVELGSIQSKMGGGVPYFSGSLRPSKM